MINIKDLLGSKKYTLENGKMKAELYSYGARINTLSFDGTDILLGYDSLEEIKNSNVYTGCTVGRFANRIHRGRFILNGKEYQLDQNEKGRNHHHGGSRGFDRFEWDGKILNDNAVEFSRISPDGEMGYPGNLKVSVTYTLEESALLISFSAACDQDTPLNLTCHTYFNLDGYRGSDCREMILNLNANHYLEVDEDLIPTGKLLPVQTTEFDFTEPKRIARDYDHCFVFSPAKENETRGSLYSKKTKIKMNLETDLPSVHVYTCSSFLDTCGKGKIPLHLHQGVALETEFFPDSPNHENFPSCILKSGEMFQSFTRFSFTKQG